MGANTLFQKTTFNWKVRNSYYKKTLAVVSDPNAYTFQKVNETWKYDNYNHSGNDLMDADGTPQDAMKYCDELALAQGFVYGPSDTSKPITLTTPGHFWIKDDVGSWCDTNRHSALVYVKTTYAPKYNNFNKSIS